MTQSLGMAPGVTAVYVYVGSTDTAILGSMTSHKPLPLQLSSSWDWPPADPKTDDPYFKKMAAQGQSFFKGAATWQLARTDYNVGRMRLSLCDYRWWYGLDHQGSRKRVGFGNGLVSTDR